MNVIHLAAVAVLVVTVAFVRFLIAADKLKRMIRDGD